MSSSDAKNDSTYTAVSGRGFKKSSPHEVKVVAAMANTIYFNFFMIKFFY